MTDLELPRLVESRRPEASAAQSARASSGQPLASASLGRWADVLWLTSYYRPWLTGPHRPLLSTWLGRILTLTLALPLTRFAVKLSKGQKPTEDNLRKYIAQAHRSKG